MALFTVAILLVILGAMWVTLSHLKLRAGYRKLPPGPWGLPIVGSLHMLGSLPHRNLSRLAKKYGPIMFMRLACVPTIVVSSPEAAKLVMKTHDVVFASRPKLQAYEYLSYGAKGVIFTEYGPYWRHVKKLCALELFSSAKINSFASVRKEEVGLLVKSVQDMASAGEVVDISAMVAGVVEDMAYRMVFGRNKVRIIDLKTLIREFTRLAGTFNLADYVPFLGPLDLQGLTQLLRTNSEAIDEFLEKIVDKHIQDVSKDEVNHMNFIDVVLSLMNKSNNSEDESLYVIDRKNVKAIILDALAGGTDTSITSIEWILSELLRHPRVMRQLQEELKNVVGMRRMVEESDLENLGYLNMVVKETLRLHPTTPLLIPHESMEDIVINGYYIPKKSRILINAWTIGRDPNVWSNNVEEFFPERFAENNIDLQGHDFELTPFGSGRRMCPGIQLGLINVRLVVSQLVHCFNWKLPNDTPPNELNMKEKFGLTMPRADHLLAISTYRLAA
ncbi:Cytochrome P450 CYP736A12 [Vitis vinifera]|uniref:Cytochrome P450 CYP736A12 n=1 Tax=Vitis vinifera TaxID=29760 RepID=A0A438JZ34_VITVI|nr:Cytochrome P450 CYP736A12 [Vitis vinifera]